MFPRQCQCPPQNEVCPLNSESNASVTLPNFSYIQLGLSIFDSLSFELPLNAGRTLKSPDGSLFSVMHILNESNKEIYIRYLTNAFTASGVSDEYEVIEIDQRKTDPQGLSYPELFHRSFSKI